MNWFELTSILVLIILIGVAAFTFFFTESYHTQLSKIPITRGLNASGSGTNVELNCPSGQVIKTIDAHYICTSGGGSGYSVENSACDPFYNTAGQSGNNFYNPNTTASALSAIQSQCDNQNSCSVVVPAASNNSISSICNGSPCPTGSTVQLVGTYQCIASP